MPSETHASSPAAGSPRPVGRPPKLPPAVREQLVLDAATEAFGEHGTSVSLDVVAARAGVNKALLYQHFGSKDELFVAAVRRARDRLVDFIAARYGRAAGRPRREQVRGQFHAFVDFARAHASEVAILRLPEAAAAFDGTGRDALAGALAVNLRGQLGAAGLPDNELPDVLAAMFTGMAGGVVRAGIDRGWDVEAVVDLLTDFTIAGLAGVERETLERVDVAVPDQPGSDAS